MSTNTTYIRFNCSRAPWDESRWLFHPLRFFIFRFSLFFHSFFLSHNVFSTCSQLVSFLSVPFRYRESVLSVSPPRRRCVRARQMDRCIQDWRFFSFPKEWENNIRKTSDLYLEKERESYVVEERVKRKKQQPCKKIGKCPFSFQFFSPFKEDVSPLRWQ